MELSRSRLQNRVYVSTAIPSLAGIVKRSLHLELLDHIGIRQRNVRCLGYVVIRRADAFDQKVVVVLPLSIHKELHAAAAKLRRRV